MTGAVPEGTVLGQGGIGMRIEEGSERRVVIPRDAGRRTRDGTRIEVSQLAPLFVVARDRVRADTEAGRDFLMREAGVDGANDLLSEVNGIRFHLTVNSTPLSKCNRL